jgi:ADP-ribose pyrophosphatase YjhB (NUDIX family)
LCRQPHRSAPRMPSQRCWWSMMAVIFCSDDGPAIWYPGHWGLFGGVVEDGEAPADALRRELHEELEFAPSAIEWFTRFDFDLAAFGQGRVHRTFYLVPVRTAELPRLRLHEGAGMQAFAPAEIFGA